MPPKKPAEKQTSKKWPEMPWDRVVDLLERIVFHIQAADSLGTGFAVSVGKQDKPQKLNHYMFATAWHVVENVVNSDHPILMTATDGKTAFEAKAGYYSIFRLGPEIFDTALIYLKSGEEILSQGDLLPMLDWDLQMAKGTEIGWVGFPGIVGQPFCFFKGSVSGYLDSPPTYLVDGVAINGVSGGPAVDNQAHIIGLVSSYIPNKVDKYTTLPGLVTIVPINAIRYWIKHKMKARVVYRGPKGT